MKNKIVIPVTILVSIFNHFIAAQEIDENMLFSDTAITIVDSAILAAASVPLAGTDSTVASFSGSVTSVAEPTVSREWFSTRNRDEIALTALMLGDLALDVRLPFGMKAFTLAETYCLPDSNVSFRIPELFLDANYRHKIYFRVGKQVLQWGRCYLWNPTDLVNVEKKSFIEKFDAREGTFGLKTHIPFGTKWNIYGFLDMNQLSSVDSLAGTVRFEGLFGGTELGIAFWGKHGRDPIAGLDFSTTIMNWSLTGEMSVTSGNNYHILDLDHSAAFTRNPWDRSFNLDSLFVYKKLDDDPVVRLSIGFMRSFDLLDIDDRLMVIGEFYFNQIGDDDNSFRKYDVGEKYDSLINIVGTDIVQQLTGTALQSLEFNSLAKFYSAFFITLNKFIISDLSLQVQSLINYNHHCAILSSGVTYTTLHNFSLSCLITGYVGPKESEYTFMGQGGSIRLTAGVSF